MDPSYTKWALSWTVGHEVDLVKPAALNTAPLLSPSQSRHVTRSQKSITTAPLTADPGLCPDDGGGNFVDTTLMVKVMGAAQTLTAFRPEERHGTTQLCGTHSVGVTIPFCTRLLDAYNKAKEGISVESEAGLGHPE